MSNTNINKNYFLTDLHNSVCVVNYYKVSGERASKLYTLNEKYLPKNLSKWPVKDNQTGLIIVWDVEKEEWRSFYFGNVISYEISDEYNNEEEQKQERGEEIGKDQQDKIVDILSDLTDELESYIQIYDGAEFPSEKRDNAVRNMVEEFFNTAKKVSDWLTSEL